MERQIVPSTQSQLYENPEDFFVGDLGEYGSEDVDDFDIEIEEGDPSSSAYDLVASDGDVDDDEGYEDDWEDTYASPSYGPQGQIVDVFNAQDGIPGSIMVGDIDPETGAPRTRRTSRMSRPRSQRAVVKDRILKRRVGIRVNGPMTSAKKRSIHRTLKNIRRKALQQRGLPRGADVKIVSISGGHYRAAPAFLTEGNNRVSPKLLRQTMLHTQAFSPQLGLMNSAFASSGVAKVVHTADSTSGHASHGTGDDTASAGHFPFFHISIGGTGLHMPSNAAFKVQWWGKDDNGTIFKINADDRPLIVVPDKSVNQVEMVVFPYKLVGDKATPFPGKLVDAVGGPHSTLDGTVVTTSYDLVVMVSGLPDNSQVAVTIPGMSDPLYKKFLQLL